MGAALPDEISAHNPSDGSAAGGPERPAFAISEQASDTQRRFLQELEQGIVENPELYHDALKFYTQITNPDITAGEKLPDILGKVFEFLEDDPSPLTKAAKALSQWHEYFHGQLNVASRHGFDDATEQDIEQDANIRKLRGKLRDARREGSRRADYFTERMRYATMNKFIGRVLLPPPDFVPSDE